MIIVMDETATEKELSRVRAYVEQNGRSANVICGKLRKVIGAFGDGHIDAKTIENIKGVSEVIKIKSNYKLASRVFKEEDTVINVNGAKFGGENLGMIAGPCTVESYEQMDETARVLKASGVMVLRGGAFKPRTSPYSFQGLGEEGLKIMRKVADKYQMAVASEVMDVSQIRLFEKYADILQVGARNMQNFVLLKKLGKIRKPVLIKRGLSATVDEFLMAAEYVLSGGNNQVILCERGIRTFENNTRNTLDLSVIPVIKKLSHLPILIDPSHATGARDKVAPMSLAATAAGCDGLMIEVHVRPEEALCDGPQSLYPAQYAKLHQDVQKIASVIGKSV